jgi:NADH oxidase (H2O2-forming)
MKNYDVIIIGGGPSGIIAGVTGRKQHTDKSFLMIKDEEKGLVPCGIPYIFYDLGDIDKNLMGPKPFLDAGGEVVIDEVTDISVEAKILKTKKGQEFGYQKLVFATGSLPIVPSFIPGYDLDGVEYIIKSYNAIQKLKTKSDKAKNIVVIGGGFIGVEVAEQLSKFDDKIVSLIEMENCCLFKAFSKEVAEKADEVIRNTGIILKTCCKVTEIFGENNSVTGVKLSDGSKIPADLVICAIGYKPNTHLAKSAGLIINDNNAITVDRYMRTSMPDIFAVGDCAGTIGFITGRTDNIMLASTATAEARILGYNLFNINLLRHFAGTLSVFSTKIGGISFASAGAIEQAAQQAGVEYVIGEFEDVDRHPGTLPGSSSLMVRLTVSPQDHAIIGGEIIGGDSTGELINVIALAIQKNVSVFELISFQIGTHPLLTTAPTKYVLIKAAENAIAKLKK